MGDRRKGALMGGSDLDGWRCGVLGWRETEKRVGGGVLEVGEEMVEGGK